MDLSEKLKYYRTVKSSDFTEKIHHYESIAHALGGQLIESDTLPVIKIEKNEYYQHSISSNEEMDNLSVFIPLLTKHQFNERIDLNDVLIFDLETTGLSGGTGTYPFLIGFGEFTHDSIRMVQYFLPDFGREISAFLDMRRITEGKKILLSYNGKTFDYPLIKNRFILNRLRNLFEHFTHLDLLHPARRLWKEALPSCSLSSIEQNVFYFSRWRDIDSGLIPMEYFNFVQTGQIGEIKRIIHHNQQDILTLAWLLLRLDMIENGMYKGARSSTELTTMLDIAISLNDMAQVESILKRLQAEIADLPHRILINYSLLLKRNGRWDNARSIWELLLEGGSAVLFACEELAKYYEHRQRIYSMAIEYTNRALKYLEFMEEIDSNIYNKEVWDNLMYRLSRLKTKLE